VACLMHTIFADCHLKYCSAHSYFVCVRTLSPAVVGAHLCV